MSRLRVAWSRIRAFVRPGDAADDFDDELRAHLEMAVDDKIRRGIEPREARRQARVELGNLKLLRESAARARGLPWLDSWWFDLKLALRMLRKSWGLTLVAGFAMAVVLSIAAVGVEILGLLTATELPLDEGERIVAVHSIDRATGAERSITPADFVRWRASLRSLESLAAFRLAERNVRSERAVDDVPSAVETVEVTEITASAFRVARVPATLGRVLVEADERPGAPDVLVVGHDAWRDRFDADPGILGRVVELDGRRHEVVGVMPEGFGLPVAQQLWIPLRLRHGDTDPVVVFGRLARGYEAAQADAELRAVGLPAADGAPTDDRVSPDLRVVPYTHAFLGDVDPWIVQLGVVAFMLLLLPPCLNIALLVYARTVTRRGELAARFVLGASRSRLVLQLFAEILVLAAGAGILALAVARITVERLGATLDASGQLPFWIEPGLSLTTVLAVASLVLFASLVAGGVPALRATGRSMRSSLRSLGHGQHVPLGRAWTLLIVLQVAAATALLPMSTEMVWGTVRSGVLGPGFDADRFVTMPVRSGTLSFARPRVVHRLAGRPEIEAVTVTHDVPGEEPWRRVRAETDAAAGAEATALGSRRVTRVGHVDPAFLDTFDLPVLAGRAFEADDFQPSRRVALVNRSFALHVLGDDAPVGRRFRYVDDPGSADLTATEFTATDGKATGLTATDFTATDRTGSSTEWFEIVGMVDDFYRHSGQQTVYHPDTGPPGPSSADGVAVTVRIRPGTERTARLLRSTVLSVDPALRLGEIQPLDEIYRRRTIGNWAGAGTVVAATVSLLLLSAAGIYALMSFTVGRRRKEIGLRAALGASPRRLIGSVFRRALLQLGAGAALGAGCAALVGRLLPIDALGGWEVPGVVPASALLMAVVALVALVGPARRGLRVDPVKELRES